MSKDGSQPTIEYLPDQRSHLYGITIATSQCLSGEICMLFVNRLRLNRDRKQSQPSHGGGSGGECRLHVVKKKKPQEIRASHMMCAQDVVELSPD